MRELPLDVRLALRVWRKSPGFTVVSILTLALGIGSVTAVASVVHGVLGKPFPYEAPERLVIVWERNLEAGFDAMFAAPPNFADWRERSESFTGLAAFTTRDVTLLRDGPERVRGALVSHGLFSLLGLKPLAGRTFTTEEDLPGAERVVVVGHALWQRLFGGRRDLVGTSIDLDGAPHTVVGILPPGADFPPPIALEGELPVRGADLFVPLAIDYAGGQRGAHYLTVVGRLAPGVSVGEAEAELSQVAAALSETYPSSNGGWGVRLVPLQDQVTSRARPALLVLLAAVLLVLLVVCANVASLLLTRSVGRSREMAVRSALGAGRLRLVRASLAESLLLALAGGALGVVLAHFAVRAIAALGPSSVPRLAEVGLDGRALWVALVASGSAALACGLAPALRATASRSSESLRDRDPGAASAGAARLGDALVVLEMALAAILLVGAALLLRSFLHLRSVDPGFTEEGVTVVTTTLPELRYREPSSRARFLERALQELGSLPGVRHVGAVNELPIAHDRQGTSFRTEGRPAPAPGQEPRTGVAVVSPDYFASLDIPLIRGRSFTQSDREGTVDVVVVNETLARLYFPGEDPVGKRIYLGMSAQTPREIVGVVGDVRHVGLAVDAFPNVYAPYIQFPRSRDLSFVLRTEAGPAVVFARVREALAAIDPALPLYDVRTLGDIVSGSLAAHRFSATLLSGFGASSLLLAALGLFGVTSYSVGRSVPELGLRMALGADAAHVLRLVLARALRLAALGVALGVAGAVFLARFLASLLYGVGPTDPGVLAAIPATLFAAALAAAYLPARRASRVDPLVALRYE